MTRAEKLSKHVFEVIEADTKSLAEAEEISNILLKTGLATRVSILLSCGHDVEQILKSLHEYIDSYRPGILIMNAEYNTKRGN